MSRPSKGYYTENEAASALGVSVDELRVLVRTHISRDPDAPNSTFYQPSELLAVRLILNGLRPADREAVPVA